MQVARAGMKQRRPSSPQALGLNGATNVPSPGISEVQLSHFHTKPKNFCTLGPLCTHHTAPSLRHPGTAWTHLRRDGDWEKDTHLFQVKACDASTGVTRYWCNWTVLQALVG